MVVNGKKHLIDRDYGLSKMEREQQANFDMPKETAFAYNAYYAGGGHYYYGQIDGEDLKVYRGYVEEKTPQNEDELPDVWKYELFKTIPIE